MSINFKQVQRDFCQSLRNPQQKHFPYIETHQLALYQNQLNENIHQVLRAVFPTLHSILSDRQWQTLLYDFYAQHDSFDPYFYNISKAFVAYLQSKTRQHYPSFTNELAHYEWSELFLYLIDEPINYSTQMPDPLQKTPLLSPLSQLLIYQFPVHAITKQYQPETRINPTYLLIVRNREHQVHHWPVDAITAKLYTSLEAEEMTGTVAIKKLIQNHPHANRAHLENQLSTMIDRDIIIAAV
jgi:uncharacterized protein